MKFNTLIIKFGLMLVTFVALALSGCSDDEGIDNRDHGYGNLQFKLYKKGTTRAADELEYLRDAKKIQVNFLQNGMNFNQTLLLSFSDAESAEFGLRSEVIKLASGNYQILSFTIFNDLEQTLITERLAEPISVSLSDGKLVMQDLEVSAVLRGKVYFRLTKDLSDIEVRAITPDRDEYTFNEIKFADVELVDVNDSKVVLAFPKMKCVFTTDIVNGTSSVLCDTLYVQAGTYKLKSFWLRDTSDKTIDYAERFDASDERYVFEIKDITVDPLQEVAIPVKINATARYIKDYIALRAIWCATGGSKDPNRKAWYYLGANYPIGANWDFDKDVDLWGQQPGVTLHSNGRVSALAIGDFDPHGEIPKEIGDLTELTSILMGTHNDAFADDAAPEFDKYGRQISTRISKTFVKQTYKNNSGTEYDVWTGIMQGRFPSYDYLNRAKKEIMARNVREGNSSELFRSMRQSGLLPNSGWEGIAKYADVSFGYITNHITGVHPNISKCTKLETIYIANSHVETLPDELSQLKNLITIELYNNPKMVKFPLVLAKIPGLTQVNIANNYQWSAKEVLDGVNAVFSSDATGPAKKIQVIYLNDNNLEELPAAMANGKDLSMIDLAYNKISKLNKLTLNVKPVQIYLDNNRLEGQPFPDDGQDFCTIEDIETFSCAGNRITEFPAKLFTSNTIYTAGKIDFSENEITHFGGDDAQWDDEGNLIKKATFTGLRCTELNLNSNKFKGGLPTAMVTSDPISEIESITIKDNLLDSIGWKGLKGFYSLKAIDMESNNISEFTKRPRFFLGLEAPYLNGIGLNYNAFSVFPQRLFNGLGIAQFFFEGQADRTTGERSFKEWPEGIDTYANLKVLKVAENDIRRVRIFPSMLNTLTIQDNPNIDITIPDAICARILGSTFILGYDKSQQYISGCPQLGIGEDNE